MVVALMSKPTNRRVAAWQPLGRRIRELREAQRLSQVDLAGLVNVSQTFISAIERGISQPERHLLRRLATTLGGDYEELAVLADYRDPPPVESATIEVPADNLSLRERVARRPAYLLRAFEDFVESLHLREPAADEDPSQKRRRVAEDDGPDDDSLGR
jgi:transcriptional regulator with XRE-family HTH domain